MSRSQTIYMTKLPTKIHWMKIKCRHYSDDEDDDDEWNWTQIPIQPAKKVERPATRFGGKPEVSYQNSIPKFKGQRSGPKNIPRECETDLDFFRLFMDDEIINTFVTNTNATILWQSQVT